MRKFDRPQVDGARRDVVRVLTVSGFAGVASLAGFASSRSQAQSQADDFAAVLKKGAVVVLLRHSTTTPGVGDPPEFKLDECATQRNLSPEGIEQAKKIGAWFKTEKLQPSAIKSSAWCRCKDTANLAFGSHQVWSPLNSTFGDRIPQPNQIDTLRAALRKVPTGKFEVWVAHGVTILPLAGERPGMGEAFVVDGQGKLLARKTFG